MLLYKRMCVFWWQGLISLITGQVLQSTIILVQVTLAFTSAWVVTWQKEHELWSSPDLASSFALSLLVRKYQGQKVRMPKDGLWDDCAKGTGKWQCAQVREGTLPLIEAYWKLHTVGGTNQPQKPFPEVIHVMWGHFTDEIKMLRCHHEAADLKYNYCLTSYKLVNSNIWWMSIEVMILAWGKWYLQSISLGLAPYIHDHIRASY